MKEKELDLYGDEQHLHWCTGVNAGLFIHLDMIEIKISGMN
jgi:hypothetical protein